VYTDVSPYGTLTRSCAADINKVRTVKNTSRLQSLFYQFGKVRRLSLSYLLVLIKSIKVTIQRICGFC